MSLEAHPDKLDPENPDAPIWRFMGIEKFRNLITTAELYFCRADLFEDETEGLPPEEYLPVLGLNPLDLRDRQELNHHLGSDAQFREGLYISCWQLRLDETCKMWKQYAKDGVAICSRYGLLKGALERTDYKAFLGLVRYGTAHLTGWNLLRFIFTKQTKFKDEHEVRAALWITDPLAGGNRHFDAENRPHPRPLTPPPAARVPDGQRLGVDLQALVTEVLVSPWAPKMTFEQVNQLVKEPNTRAMPNAPSQSVAIRPTAGIQLAGNQGFSLAV